MGQKKIILTIDDSPSHKMKEKVDYLKANHIGAIFFCTGQKIEQYPELVRYALAQGFNIGNHAYHHHHFSSLSLEEIESEINKTDQIITDLYLSVGKTWSHKYFRFPYGDKGDGLSGRLTSCFRKKDTTKRKAIQKLLEKKGYTGVSLPGKLYQFYENAHLNEEVDWHWTFDSMDFSVTMPKPIKGLESEQKIIDRINTDHPKNPLVKKMKEKYWLSAVDKTEIFLIHDHVESHELFFKIIQTLQQLPVEFLSIPLPK